MLSISRLAPGARPGRTDSTRLRALAAARTDFAPVACATLRYFYPACACAAATAAPANARSGSGSGQRPAGTRVAGKAPAVQLQAYPNPARDRLTIKVLGACPAGVHLELLEVGTGRVVQRVALAHAAAELAVAELAAGVYAGRAVSAEGRVLGTCKAVVIH